MVSEIGQLCKVLVSRPSLAHERLTHANCASLLFEEPIWVQRAREEHDAFRMIMEARGVRVYEVQHLLEDTLTIREGRAFVLDRLLSSTRMGPIFGPILRQWLDGVTSHALARVCVGGLVLDDLPASLDGRIFREWFHKSDFIVPPLPNLLFQRDPLSCIGSGVVINPMHFKARNAESSIVMRSIVKFHPLFHGTPIWYGDSDEAFDMATLEGGDIMPIGNGCLFVGVSERTSLVGVGAVASALLNSPQANVDRIVAIRMPKTRAQMHLDTVFTILDRNCVTAFTEVTDALQCYSIRRGRAGDMEIAKESGTIYDVYKEVMGVSKLKVIATGGDMFEADREQWDDGNNVLAIHPGCVIAYERNTYTNDKIRAAGIELVTISGQELGKGRGGPHCMSCPIERSSIATSSTP